VQHIMTIVFLAVCAAPIAQRAGADDLRNSLAKAPIIEAEAVKVHMGEPVLIDQASPKVKEWGPYRMPKVFRLPSGVAHFPDRRQQPRQRLPLRRRNGDLRPLTRAEQ
jgi:hypothetical protein